jgi:prepilin-type N-terminal cleavage/methylation domain-containing protein
MNTQRGVTLIELVVVIVVTGGKAAYPGLGIGRREVIGASAPTPPAIPNSASTANAVTRRIRQDFHRHHLREGQRGRNRVPPCLAQPR